jgi:hypothetical protein
MAIGEAEYFEQRLDDQINGYDRKSSTNQTSYKRLRLIEIVAAASIPLLAGFAQGPWYIGVSIGVVGLIVAVLAGIVSLYRFQENWNDYRASAESLKQEKYLYLARAEPYNGDRPIELLAQRVEALLKSETTGWAQAMRAAGAAEKAERERASDPTP